MYRLILLRAISIRYVDEVDVYVQVVGLLSIKVGEVQVAMLLSKFERYLSIYRSGCYLVQNEYIHVQCAGLCVSCYPSKLKTFTTSYPS